ncbi:MAG: ankyrin repeat domain-containing protein [Candidatus Dependentiae bacterium]|nr:ankyrin repeat domain-containing protein [Candidatus Dependentiae bacterium]
MKINVIMTAMLTVMVCATGSLLAMENLDEALINAVKTGDAYRVKKLIEEGVDVNKADKAGWTPLMFASYGGHDKVVAQLLREGANFSKANNNGKTTFLMPADTGNVNVVTKFLAIAAEVGDVDMVGKLIAAGADVNSDDNFDDRTPLLIAADKGHDKVVAQLLAAGADVNKADKKFRTSLIVAVGRNHDKVVDLLIKSGVSIDPYYAWGKLPDTVKDSLKKELLEKRREEMERALFTRRLEGEKEIEGFLPSGGGHQKGLGGLISQYEDLPTDEGELLKMISEHQAVKRKAFLESLDKKKVQKSPAAAGGAAGSSSSSH